LFATFLTDSAYTVFRFGREHRKVIEVAVRQHRPSLLFLAPTRSHARSVNHCVDLDFRVILLQVRWSCRVFAHVLCANLRIVFLGCFPAKLPCLIYAQLIILLFFVL
jgi:hypothetical protein